MSFHLGKPILVMLVLSVLTGMLVAFRPAQRRAEVTLWVFADIHGKTYGPLIEQFEKDHHCTVNMNLITSRAQVVRLGSLFMSNPTSEEIPDLVEVEISQAGQYFRPPVREIGFEPLEPRLRASGWFDQIVKQRLSPWTKEGVIFGAPHDVHPTTLTYRADLFEEAGVDLEAPKTWAEFQEACLKFKAYWRGKGYAYRHPIELNQSTTEHLLPMLLQRGVNLIDDYNRVRLNDPKVAETIAFYAQLVVGPRNVAGQFIGQTGISTRDMMEGNICALMTPDWRVTQVKNYAPGLAGKLRMRPLPVFEAGDSATTTMGGTMMGLTRASRNKDLAFALMEYLYFDPKTLPDRRRMMDILPPVVSSWDDPFYHRADPFYGGQKTGELFTELAARIPARYSSPASKLAADELAVVLNKALDYVRERGSADGLVPLCQTWLNESAADVQKRIDQWDFD
jgi:arabinosaccharide transport system substrate-binding protein